MVGEDWRGLKVRRVSWFVVAENGGRGTGLEEGTCRRASAKSNVRLAGSVFWSWPDRAVEVLVEGVSGGGDASSGCGARANDH